MSFTDDLGDLINIYSLEDGSNTPDFLLAEYLSRCLDNWNITVTAREKWYGGIRSPILRETQNVEVKIKSPTGCHHHSSAYTDHDGNLLNECSACRDGGFDR